MSYSLLSRTEVPDYHGTAELYEHTGSGAQVFHLRNDDPENMFAFAFLTLPKDSTGVAHILEHTVFSGSREFPLKDPFLHLLKGSVNTYLNALTYPDKTVYPAASPVKQDLFNLMRVYGDAVFFPLLKRELFHQEGHRLQFREDGSLERSGVVLNEMKGSYANHDSIVAEKCYQSLFPNTVYRNDSGGDPLFIPDLTYEEFTAFHERYYHPSNVRVVLYGDTPTEEYLDFLHETFFSKFERQAADFTVPEQLRWDSPRTTHAVYPVPSGAETSKMTSVTVNWLLFPVTERERLLRMSALSEMLLGNSGAPLYKALIDSGLGQDLSPVFGLETDLHETVFSAGLRGTEEEMSERIEGVITTTLRHLVDRGLDDDLREGALRRIEFRNRELKSGPNGLRVMSRVLRSWMYGGDPSAGLHFTAMMSTLRGELTENPRLFEDMIDELLLGNRHRTTVVVVPAPGLSEDRAEEERAELEVLAGGLTPEERMEIEAAQTALEELQETVDDPVTVARLPVLSLDEVPMEIRTIPVRKELWEGGIPVFRHELFTNGIAYVDFSFDLQGLPAEWIEYLNLFGSTATEVGLPGIPHQEFQRQMNLKTGGITTMISHQYKSDDPSRVLRLFTVRLRLLESQLDEGIDLFQRFLAELDFSDTDRLAQVEEEVFVELRSALIPSGHYFSGLRASARLSPLAHLEDKIGGIAQYEFLRRLLAGGSSEAAEKSAPLLAEMVPAIFDPSRMMVNLTGDETIMNDLAKRIRAVVGSISARASVASRRSLNESAVRAVGEELSGSLNLPGDEFLLTSSGVSHVASAIPGRRFLEPGYAAQEVLSHILRTGPLWEEIRMAGGAYGAFASSKSLEGLFTFGSYRDPNDLRTLETYRSVLERAAQEPPSPRELELALISLLGRELRPLVPRDQGFIDFKRNLHGITDDLRRRVRYDLKEVTPEEVSAAAAYLRSTLDVGVFSILGGASARESVTGAFPDTVCTDLGI